MEQEREEPVFRDALFHRRRHKGKWDVVDAPVMPAVPLADTHAHIQLLPDPALSLARAGMHQVTFIELITDLAEDGTVLFDRLAEWERQAEENLQGLRDQCVHEMDPRLAHMRIGCGVHPHSARLYNDGMEAQLVSFLQDPRVSAVGEIGLDYHYDYSPRDVQQQVFRRQVQLAKEMGLPVILHMREAHDDGFAIMEDEGFPEAGTLLHCFNLDTAELERWLEHDCFIAFGGPLTFKKSDAVREAATLVPDTRILTETDAPFMTPEPLRGTICGPEHVIWTADELCAVRGALTDEQRAAFLSQVYDNALTLLDRPASAPSQHDSAEGGV